MLSILTLKFFANTDSRDFCCSEVKVSVCMRTLSLPTFWTIFWEVIWASRRDCLAVSIEAFFVVTVNDEPPLNSIPRCKPWVNNVKAEAKISRPENEYQIFRLPTKSIEVSPR